MGKKRGEAALILHRWFGIVLGLALTCTHTHTPPTMGIARKFTSVKIDYYLSPFWGRGSELSLSNDLERKK